MYVGIEKKEKGRNRAIKTRIQKRAKTKSENKLHPTREILSCIQLVGRLRAVPLFSWSIEQNARDTQMTTRMTGGAREASPPDARARLHLPH